LITEDEEVSIMIEAKEQPYFNANNKGQVLRVPK